MQARYKRDRAEILAKQRARRARDPETFRAKGRAWYENMTPAARKAWQRRNHLRSAFGLTPEAYDAMLASQGGGCAICGSREPRNQHGYLSIDHDHTTGAVRGILCDPCNNGIGRLRDDPAIAARAADYLAGSPGMVGTTSLLMFC